MRGKSANKLCPSCKKVVSGQRVGNIEYLEHGTVRYCKHQECGHRWSTIEIQRDKYKEIQSRLFAAEHTINHLKTVFGESLGDGGKGE